MIETRSFLLRPPTSGPRSTLVSDARADFAMLCSLAFLLLSGPGPWSPDRRSPRDPRG